MSELKKGEWISYILYEVFILSENETLELIDQNYIILNSDENEFKNLNTTDRECMVSDKDKTYVIREKLILK